MGDATILRQLNGAGWLAELHRIRSDDAELGHWSHTFLVLARTLNSRGLLPIQIEPPPRWRSDRIGAEEDFLHLRDSHRRWLTDQAEALLNLSTDPEDPVGRCAKYFLDWLIWYWTADGCHPETLAVRRDAIKHDCRYIWWSDAARAAIERARHNGLNASGVVEHEHAVPKRRLISLLLERNADAKGLLEKFARAALVTKSEHRRLNRYFKRDMPPGWNPHDKSADAFARYRDRSVSIDLNPPLGAG